MEEEESDSEDDFLPDDDEDSSAGDSDATEIELHPSTAEAIRNFLSYKPSSADCMLKKKFIVILLISELGLKLDRALELINQHKNIPEHEQMFFDIVRPLSIHSTRLPLRIQGLQNNVSEHVQDQYLALYNKLKPTLPLPVSVAKHKEKLATPCLVYPAFSHTHLIRSNLPLCSGLMFASPRNQKLIWNLWTQSQLCSWCC